MIAETAELIARLQLQDQMSPGLRSATGGLAHAESQVGRTHGALGRLQGAAGNIGGAFKHAAGQIGLLTGALGIAGLAGAGFEVERFLSDSVSKAEDFGLAAGKLRSIMGGTSSSAQELTAVLQHFGIEGDGAVKIVGMLEKNLGNLAAGSGKGAATMLTNFGFNVLDASGKVKDAQTVITDFTDYFNNSATPASEKAALGAKLFGRQWQTLLPILQSGSAGIKSAADEAKALGLTEGDLTTKAQAMKAATRDWNTTMDALKITIGADLLPVLTDLTKEATKFVSDHRADIRQWFLKAKDMALGFVNFVKDAVLPAVADLGSKAVGFWNSIPPGLRDLLVKGIVADRTVKFLFGFSLADVGKDVLGGVLKAVGGQFFQRGGPANPMYVIAEGGGLGGGGSLPGKVGGLFSGGGALGAGSLIGGTIAPIVIGALSALAIDQFFKGQKDALDQSLKTTPLTLDAKSKLSSSGLAQAMALGNEPVVKAITANTLGPWASSIVNELGNIGTDAAGTKKNTDPLASLLGTIASHIGLPNFSGESKDTGTTSLKGTLTSPATNPESAYLSGTGALAPKTAFTNPESAYLAPTQMTAMNTAQTNDQLQTLASDTTTNTRAVTTSGNKVTTAVNGIKPAISELSHRLIAKFDLNHNGLVSMRETLAQKLGISVEKLDKLREGVGGLDKNFAARLGISNEKLQKLIGESTKIVGQTGDAKTFYAVMAQHLGTTSSHLRDLVAKSGGWNGKLAGALHISNDQLQKIKAEATSEKNAIDKSRATLGISYDKLKEIKATAEKTNTAIDATRTTIKNKNFSPTINVITNVKTNVSSRDVRYSTDTSTRYGKIVQ